MKILIMGLPGSGKSTLAKSLHELLPNSVWLNADHIRRTYNDWDFSLEGRLRQAARLRKFADVCDDIAILDFVCPLPETRNIVNADTVVWLDTISHSRFEDTNKMFVPPDKYDYRITSFEETIWSDIISKIYSLL
jgi:adenylylsulfate kinase